MEKSLYMLDTALCHLFLSKVNQSINQLFEVLRCCTDSKEFQEDFITLSGQKRAGDIRWCSIIQLKRNNLHLPTWHWRWSWQLQLGITTTDSLSSISQPWHTKKTRKLWTLSWRALRRSESSADLKTAQQNVPDFQSKAQSWPTNVPNVAAGLLDQDRNLWWQMLKAVWMIQLTRIFTLVFLFYVNLILNRKLRG